MKYLTTLLPKNIFRRIHRSYFINLTHVSAFGSTTIELGNIKVPIGESYKRVANSRRKTL